MERRQIRMQTRYHDRSDRHEGLRMKAVLVAAVWLGTALVAMVGAQNVQSLVSPSGYALAGIWGLWTVWLADLLRRLSKG
jgi:hypothetical protein